MKILENWNILDICVYIRYILKMHIFYMDQSISKPTGALAASVNTVAFG